MERIAEVMARAIAAAWQPALEAPMAKPSHYHYMWLGSVVGACGDFFHPSLRYVTRGTSTSGEGAERRHEWMAVNR